MAYQAKRKKLYTEEFQLVDETGAIVHTLQVALDPDSMVRKLSEKHLALIHALEQVQGINVQTEPGKGLKTLGNAVNDLITAVFGDEAAGTILDFYDGRYVEMCDEVVPFITQVVVPHVRRIAQENRRQIAASYGRKKRKW